MGLSIMLLVSLGLQTYLYVQRGGISGFLMAYSTGDLLRQGDSAIVAMFAESFPILAMMGYAVLARRQPLLASWPALALVMLAFFVLAIFFGGLSGSRSNTMYSVFIAAGTIHFLVRPIPKKLIFIGLIFVFTFAYVYAVVYKKGGGLRGLENVQSGATFSELEETAKLGRYSDSLLLAELSRTDLQSFILHQVCRRDSDFAPALGRSYYATLCHLIPSFVWHDRPMTLIFEATEMVYGKGSFDPVSNYSLYVHGMAGEAMMNFGVIGVPLAFLAWTFVVARTRKWILSWNGRDARLFLAPWLAFLAITLFVSDSPNMLLIVCKWAGVPFLLLLFCCSRVPQRMPLRTRTAVGAG